MKVEDGKMRNVKRLKRIIYGRTMIVITLLLVQIIILLGVFVWLRKYTVLFYGGFSFISVVVMIAILNEKTDPSFQISWLIPVLVIPIFGSLFYLFVHRSAYVCLGMYVCLHASLGVHGGWKTASGALECSYRQL